MKFKMLYVLFFITVNILFASDVINVEIDGYVNIQKVYKGNYYFMDKKTRAFKDFVNDMEVKYSPDSGEIIISQRSKG